MCSNIYMQIIQNDDMLNTFSEQVDLQDESEKNVQEDEDEA